MEFKISIFLLAFCSHLLQTVQAKAVFAHYMIGTVTQAHAEQDIKDAVAMGLDGFALNIGDPTADYTAEALGYLFNYAEGVSNFKLFISMDVWASGSVCNATGLACGGPVAFTDLVKNYIGNSAYYKGGPNNLPMVSTFADGGLHNDQWTSWKDSLGQDIYFVPDFDGTAGYYKNADAWWSYWGDVVDGLFSWESAWPERAGLGGQYAGDVSPDVTVMEGTVKHGKSYMIGLSPLQYKNSYNTNIYRAGDRGLIRRMLNIFGMDNQPDFIQVISWNDGPESHYIGNLWPEQNTDYQPSLYATQARAPHTAWQTIITAFIQAWKKGGTIQDMLHPSGEIVGAMWYKTILQSDVNCPVTDYYTGPPDGYSTGTDQLHFALSVPSSMVGYTLKLYSGGTLVDNQVLTLGLNTNSAPNIQTGVQRLEILDKSGSIVKVAQGPYCIEPGCPETIYNMNYQVVPLTDDTGTTTCQQPQPNIGLNLESSEETFTRALAVSDYDFEGNLSDAATRLYRFDGCTSGQQQAIYSGWQQSWKIMNLLYSEANSGINFNEASAVEYLGPPALNSDQQKNFNAMYKNLATIQPGWVPGFLSWRLHIRCDDPSKKCPCGSRTTLKAYTTNKDASSGLARINFCPNYFGQPTLDSVMSNADKSFGVEWYANLNNYMSNQASTWIHELFHVDWVSQAESYGSNKHVKDLWIGTIVKDQGFKYIKAYGPIMCKGLARYKQDTGSWIIQNADSLSMYALARYVQKALGNVYPHLPLAPPPPSDVKGGLGSDTVFTLGDMFSLDGDGYATIINQTDVDDVAGYEDTICNNDSDEDYDPLASVVTYNTSGLAIQSDFPSDYLSDLASWEADS